MIFAAYPVILQLFPDYCIATVVTLISYRSFALSEQPAIINNNDYQPEKQTLKPKEYVKHL